MLGLAVAGPLAIGACAFEAPGNDAPPMLADDTGDSGDPGEDDGPAADDGDDPGDAESGSEGGFDDAPGDDGEPPDPAGDTGSDGVENDCPRVRVSVSAGASLNVRPSPSTDGEPIGALPNRSVVDVLAEEIGETVQGTDLWFHVADTEIEGFVSAAYAECTLDEPPDLLPPDGFWLPLECGASATISQGNFGTFSHQNNAAYAFDFSLGIGTPMVAIADGIVIHRYDATGPGDPCYDGGDSGCYPYANLVTLLHGDGTTSIYKHLSDVLVSDGEFVPRGRPVGLSGSTGYSTGPHAHVMRQEDCGQANCPSIPLEFVDAGVPQTGDTVTSENCP
jgi:murein DD-endopeptidase MepM/ murein hydrolase activator NlpD